MCLLFQAAGNLQQMLDHEVFLCSPAFLKTAEGKNDALNEVTLLRFHFL